MKMSRVLPDVEWHGSVALVHLAEELPASLHLQHVGHTSRLEYCGLGILLLVLAISSADQSEARVNIN